MEQAEQLVAEGKAGQAAKLYHEVMKTNTPQVEPAAQKLRGLVETPPAAIEEAIGVFQVALEVYRENQPLLPNLYEQGVKVVEQHEANNPSGAIDLLEIISPLAPKPADVLALRRQLLERLVAASPNDPVIASRLAVVYEALGESAKCEALLTPHAQNLGQLDGAAILGASTPIGENTMRHTRCCALCRCPDAEIACRESVS